VLKEWNAWFNFSSELVRGESIIDRAQLVPCGWIRCKYADGVE
jgi:hypothetical protein